jgi:hypothetical protein
MFPMSDALTTKLATTTELLEMWDREGHRQAWKQVLANPDLDQAGREVAEQALAECRDSSPLLALAANAELVKLLAGRRWFVMRDAREEGSTWEEIGQSLGVSAEDARAYYRGKIELQELHVGDLHDAGRARRVLEDGRTD